MFKTVIKTGKQAVIKTFLEPRFYLALLLWMAAMGPQMMNLKELSEAVDVKVPPCAAPFFFQNLFLVLLMALGALMIFCDVPQVTENACYQIIRCGRRNWFFGQLLRILIVGGIYTAGVMGLPLLYLGSRLGWMSGWGKLFGSLGQMHLAGDMEVIFQVSYPIIAEYSSGGAMLLLFAILYLNILLAANLILAGNILLSKSMGAMLGGALIVLPYLTIRLSDTRLAYYIAPLSWTDLSLFGSFVGDGLPGLPYVFGVLIGANFLCILGAYIGIMKKDMVLQSYR